MRATAETRLAVRLALDGASRVRVATGAGLYDHFLEQLAFHAGFDLVLEGSGDLETGDHHTAEDAALAFGAALDAALGDRRGIARYGDAVVPMDDALARAAVDLGGRAHAELKLEHDPGMAAHMLSSLAQAARASIHVEATGRDAHHVAEAAFKAVGRALRVGGAAARAKGCRRRRDCCEGRDLRVRRGQRPLGRARASRGSAPSSIADVRGADLAVLPGVGSARAAMAGLRARGHDVALRARVAAARPVLGICLGLQLALEWTEEDGGVEGLGLCRAARCGCARAASRAWAGREVDDARRVLLRALVRRRRRRARPRGRRASSPRCAPARSSAASSIPEKSGAAGARYLAACSRRSRSLSLA